MNNELKPCPFCGGEFKIVKEWSDGTKDYACPTSQYSCPVGRKRFNTDDIGKWNTRPIEDKLQAELETEIRLHEDILDKELKVRDKEIERLKDIVTLDIKTIGRVIEILKTDKAVTDTLWFDDYSTVVDTLNSMVKAKQALKGGEE